MNAPEFRAHLERLRWSQRGFAAFLGVAHNTVHRWALAQAVIPERIASWLEAEPTPPERNPLPWKDNC